MNTRPRQPDSTAAIAPPRVVLQRCSCGGGGRGECEGCRRKKLLQRSAATMEAVQGEAPPLVHAVLSAPGDPMDHASRARLGPRFGYDFSAVRVHTGGEAAASARAVGAHAYTVGPHVVFGEGQFNPGTPAGDRLLAHELAHVVQQRWTGPIPDALGIEHPSSAAEHEADRTAVNVLSDREAGPMSPRAPSVMRRLVVDEPRTFIPNPGGAGIVQTNAGAIEGYLRDLAGPGNPSVDLGTGEVRMGTPEFCEARGALSRTGRGFWSGFKTGAKIGVFAGIVGAIPGAIIGGLIGAIAGLFGGADSKAEESSTPTGSTCICDFINSRQTWHIRINDALERPHTGDTFVEVWSPNSPRIPGAATRSGRMLEIDPWLVLGHELCGHLWLENLKGRNDDEDRGQARESGVRGRENLLRREHGLEQRATSLKDPFCGESFFRRRDEPPGTVHPFEMHDQAERAQMRQAGMSGADETNFDECMQERVRVLGEGARRYRVEERIP